MVTVLLSVVVKGKYKYKEAGGESEAIIATKKAAGERKKHIKGSDYNYYLIKNTINGGVSY